MEEYQRSYGGVGIRGITLAFWMSLRIEWKIHIPRKIVISYTECHNSYSLYILE